MDQKRFTASLASNGFPRIISVWASDKKDAQAKIEQELDKPGRAYILDQWKRNGGHIIEN